MNRTSPENPPKLPRHVVRCGAVSAITWSNTRTVDGELREFLQVELVKNYRDANGEWQKTHRFWPEDLPAVATVARRTFEALRVREEWPAEEMKADRAHMAKSETGRTGKSAEGS